VYPYQAYQPHHPYHPLYPLYPPIRKPVETKANGGFHNHLASMCPRSSLLPVILLVLLAGLWGCGCELDRSPGSDSQLVVMTYNVGNLFDAYYDGTEYAEYTPEAGWTGEGFLKRLDNLAQVIVQTPGLLPDLVVLQEIEHDGVLAQLLARGLSTRGYCWYAATADTGSAIQTGVISRLPIKRAVVHGVTGCRSVLEVVVEAGGTEVVVLGFHAKSRKEGALETEAQRIELTRVLQGVAQEKWKQDPDAVMLLAGDCNESADAFLRGGQAVQTALVPVDSPYAGTYAAQGSLLVGGSPPVAQSWYSWWLDRNGLLDAEAQGSYWYQGVWESFDQILFSEGCFSGSPWSFDHARVVAHRMLCDASGYPQPWDQKLKKGFSDHLPFYVVLKSR